MRAAQRLSNEPSRARQQLGAEHVAELGAMADLIRGDVALPLDHFGEIPTATVLRHGQRLARQGFAARNDIETPLGRRNGKVISSASPVGA